MEVVFDLFPSPQPCTTPGLDLAPFARGEEEKEYTGQRPPKNGGLEAEVGLYFHSARWRGAAQQRSVPGAKRRGFDPILGRFAQADTIIPQPGNPLAWDRYAYTYNNPINFSDPSGHMIDCREDGDCHHESNAQLRERYIYSSDTGFSGADMHKLFVWYQTNPGWWNEDSDFTLDEFVGLMLMYDISSSVDAAGLISEASARHVWGDARVVGGLKAFCSSDDCNMGFFNYLAFYVESAMRRASTNNSIGSPYDTSKPSEEDRPNTAWGADPMSMARKIGHSITHAIPQWRYYSDLKPYHWGNSPTPGWADDVQRGTEIGMHENNLYYFQYNFVVYSDYQRRYWESIYGK